MTNTIENEYTSDWFSPPGEIIDYIMRERGIPLRIFANRMEMSRKEAFRLLASETEITDSIACKLENAFGLPNAHFWILSEELYRESLANQNNVMQNLGNNSSIVLSETDTTVQ